MHHFCDASEHGYGSVSYLRLTNKDDEIHAVLVLGKSRLTPLKQITIPRLELASAMLAAKMDQMLRSKLELKIPVGHSGRGHMLAKLQERSSQRQSTINSTTPAPCL